MPRCWPNGLMSANPTVPELRGKREVTPEFAEDEKVAFCERPRSVAKHPDAPLGL
jgi:hypothetical protein